jgi:hypothetical protein
VRLISIHWLHNSLSTIIIDFPSIGKDDLHFSKSNNHRGQRKHRNTATHPPATLAQTSVENLDLMALGSTTRTPVRSGQLPLSWLPLASNSLDNFSHLFRPPRKVHRTVSPGGSSAIPRIWREGSQVPTTPHRSPPQPYAYNLQGRDRSPDQEESRVC